MPKNHPRHTLSPYKRGTFVKQIGRFSEQDGEYGVVINETMDFDEKGEQCVYLSIFWQKSGVTSLIKKAYVKIVPGIDIVNKKYD